MGHRALVAVARCDSTYALARSQWGATALFDSERSAESVVAEALEVGGPTAIASDATDVLEALALPGDEALFVADGGLTGYLVCPLRPGLSAGSTPRAALVPVSNPAAARRLDVFCRTVREVLADAVDVGLCSPSLASGYLAVRLARHPDCPEEVLWVPARG